VRYSVAGSRVKHILGPYPAIGLAKARELARDVLEQVALGVDPRHVTEGETVADAVKLYDEKHVSKLRASTAAYVKRELAVASEAWRGRSLASITRRDVIALMDAAEKRGPTVRNSMLQVLASFFSFCEGRDLIASSPTRGVKRIRGNARDRVLSDPELATVWRAAVRVGGAYGALTKLLILSGCRRNEIAFLEWSEVSKDVIEISPEKTKTAIRLRVPITSAIRAVLDQVPKSGRYVLKGAKPLHVTGTCEDVLGVKLASRWTWHDLRRTFASGLQKLGVPFAVIEAALGHRVIGTIAGTYQKYNFEPEIKAALEKWSAHIETITAAS
jgi:integrase